MTIKNIIFSLKDHKVISLCAAGACPYVEINGKFVHFFDDEGKIKVISNEKGLDIYIPREWIEALIKQIPMDDKQ